MGPDNIDVAKKIIRGIAEETYKDEEILDFLISDNELLRIAIEAGRTKEGIRETARAVTKKYVKTPMFAKTVEAYIENHKDKELLAKAAANDDLINELIDDERLYELVKNEGEINDKVLSFIVSRTLEKLN